MLTSLGLELYPGFKFCVSKVTFRRAQKVRIRCREYWRSCNSNVSLLKRVHLYLACFNSDVYDVRWKMELTKENGAVEELEEDTDGGCVEKMRLLVGLRRLEERFASRSTAIRSLTDVMFNRTSERGFALLVS